LSWGVASRRILCDRTVSSNFVSIGRLGDVNKVKTVSRPGECMLHRKILYSFLEGRASRCVGPWGYHERLMGPTHARVLRGASYEVDLLHLLPCRESARDEKPRKTPYQIDTSQTRSAWSGERKIHLMTTSQKNGNNSA
jgi:hypothetical protein